MNNACTMKVLNARSVAAMLFIVFFFILSAGQTTPQFTHYLPKTYDAFYQNWCITKDTSDRVYVANGDGLLIYDGEMWNLMELPNLGSVFSVASTQSGRIILGGHNEFGYLDVDSMGAPEYVSLVSNLDTAYLDFDIIFSCYSDGSSWFFSAKKYLFVWNGIEVKIESLTGSTALEANQRIFAQKEDILFEWIDSSFQEAGFSGNFLSQRIIDIERWDDQRLLILTDKNLYLTGEKTREIIIDNPEFVDQNTLYSCEVLLDGTIAIGSIYKGLIVIDIGGQELHHWTEENLLPSNAVMDILQDPSGLLWVATFNGIVKIEHPSEFYFFERDDVPQIVMDIQSHGEYVYAGGTTGLFRTKKGELDFSKVDVDLGPFAWDLCPFGKSLLIAGQQIFMIDSSTIRKASDRYVRSLQRSKIDTNRIFLGLSPGLTSMYYQEGRWEDERRIDGIDFEVATIVEDTTGMLWLRTNAKSIGRYPFYLDGQVNSEATLEILDSENGFPESIGIQYLIDGELYVVARDGTLFRFDSHQDRFIKDQSLYESLGLADANVKLTTVDDDENLWIVESRSGERFNQLVAWKQPNGTYKLESLAEQRIMEMRRDHVYPDLHDSLIWYKGTEKIIAHDISKRSYQTAIEPKVLITGLQMNHDSTLFAGFGSPIEPIRLNFAKTRLRFTFSSPSYFAEEQNQYRSRLVNHDEDWSPWTEENQRDFTTLSAGHYTFQIQSKNIFDHLSEIRNFSFIILPPWHRTWWAYLLYLLAGLLSTAFIVRWRSNELRKEKLALEGMVASRTAELQISNDKLQAQKVKLKAQAEKLRTVDQMKSRLFANISHEFRTPLTLIKGPLDQLNRFPESKLSTAHLGMMTRNTNRLLRLVNQLLDLSKLDSGTLPVNLSEGNVYQVIRMAASAFSSHAAERNLDFQIKIPSLVFWASFDRAHIEKIVYNLLSNAFKFTPNDGKILIEAAYADGQLLLKVEDSGIGIEAEDQVKIFERFYQVDASSTRQEEGSGIGLALVRELVEKMDGRIHLESEVGRGSIFMVGIPLRQILAPTSDKEKLVQKIDRGLSGNQRLATDQESQSVAKQDTPTVLVVEDNSDMRHYIVNHLSHYQTIQAGSGSAGLQAALEHVPDLIISDIMMPEMDGIQLCELLKTDQRISHIPVIMLTAKVGMENKLKGLETGADSYLTKPFDARELQVRVRNLIEQRLRLRKKFTTIDHFAPQDIEWSSYDQQFLHNLMDLLEEKHDDPDFGIAAMMEKLAMSRTQLHRKVKALTDQSPGALLREFRLKRAAQLLAKGETVTQSAYAAGFNNISHFGKIFREKYGSKPSEYKGEARNAQP